MEVSHSARPILRGRGVPGSLREKRWVTVYARLHENGRGLTAILPQEASAPEGARLL